jgi:hypothetical protein
MTRNFCCVAGIAFLCCVLGPRATAEDRQPVRLKLEGLSLRNRSGAPIAIQIKLEYNKPQILQGDLLLELHDTIRIVGNEDLRATVRFNDLVLAGTDYIFNAILPPLTTTGQGNLAVRAWFETDSGRIPLSSSLQLTDPPGSFDLLVPDSMDRSVVLCSASGRADYRFQTEKRRYLDTILSLDQFNPSGSQSDQSQLSGRMRVVGRSRRIQFHAAAWSSRDLPEDPLSYCCFDIVLLADGALGRLSEPQMEGLEAWIAAGGSLCIYPDEPLRRNQLGFIQKLMQNNRQNVQFSQDDEGSLMLIGDAGGPNVTADYGLGRVALIDPSFDLSQGMSVRQIGQLNAWLWRVRAGSGVHQGRNWEGDRLLQILKQRGIIVTRAQNGELVMTGRGLYRALGPGVTETVTEMQLRNRFNIQERFSSQVESLVSVAESQLLPTDVQMVPTWIVGCILVGYVFAVGPLDYFVLGFFRIRKYTWVVFPVVTILFTMLTVGVANDYMGSDDTGGSITISDVGSDGNPLRSTRLQMLFYGSRATHRADHTMSFVTPAQGSMSLADENNVEYTGESEPLNFSGHFPQSFSLEQLVQQWTPRMLRTFSIRPDDVTVPQLDWSNPAVVTTETGRRRLGLRIRELAPAGTSCSAVVLHRDRVFELTATGSLRSRGEYRLQADALRSSGMGRNSQRPQSGSFLMSSLLACTTCGTRSNYFGVVSQLSPQGSGTLEDLMMHDPDDPEQWVLMIVYQRENNYEVFRRRFIVRDSN